LSWVGCTARRGLRLDKSDSPVVDLM
jgi:hypothetical protein